MTPYSIYIVDDEPSIREGISYAFEAEYTVNTFQSAESAIAALNGSPPDLVLLDVGLPGMGGVEALAEMKKDHPELLVIMITAYEDVKTVISAMKLGAYDYIVKPIHMESLEVTVRNALENVRLRKEIQDLQERYLKETLPCFISESEALQDVMDFIAKVAKSPDTPVLILGETGTGKELIARAIHQRSPNFQGPFVTVNCAAIPKDLIESELFGYEKGAFSGALASGKRGLIEEAADGTLFLDEVGDLSPDAQAKLLRFLEEGEFYKLGGTRERQVRTRVVSATNKDLDRMIEEGLFRKDLYFRLGVVKVTVPSLCERKGDIMPLARHFLNEFNGKFGRAFTSFSAAAQKALLAHKWTGNVRELRNRVERAVLTGVEPEIIGGDLVLDDARQPPGENSGVEARFPPLPAAGIDLAEVLHEVEKFYILEAMQLAGGNESKAAKLLNMNHHTFRYRRKKID